MDLTIKPIVNGLFKASVRHEAVAATAIGETQDEAAQRAMERLKQKLDGTQAGNNIDWNRIKNDLNLDEQGMHVGGLFTPNTDGSMSGTSLEGVTKGAIGTALLLSSPILNAAATTVGIAKTGTVIGTLHGAAHAAVALAWVGFGSMKVGMFIMGALPVIGTLLILDNICGREHGVPLIDWVEEGWRRYETQCELDELKKTVKPDADHQVRAKTQAGSLAQLGN